MKNKVLLIAPLFENPKYPTYLPSENLGIGYIAGYLRDQGVQVDILDANMYNIPSKEIVKHINTHEYVYIGISASFQNLMEEVIIISNQIKMIDSDIHISLGGHFPTFRHKEILESCSNIDSVMRGDGEITAFELYKSLANKKNLKNVLGITYRDDENIIVTPDRPLVEELSVLPWPARDTLEFVKKRSHTWATQLTTSRGCYGNCLFCDIRSFYKQHWRARNVNDILDEIQFLISEYGCDTFRFTDDEFIGPFPDGYNRAMQFAEEVIRKNIKAKFMISARAEDVEEKLFCKLKQANVIDCLIGIESGVDRILKLYNKRVTVKQNQDCINILNKLDISLNLAYIMFDPRMTYDELVQNYFFLKKNNAISIDALRSWFWPLYGTPALKQFEKENLIVAKSLSDVEYRFIDFDVANVYKLIKLLCYKVFEIDKMFQKAIMNNIDHNKYVFLYEEYRTYWIDYFETALFSKGEKRLEWARIKELSFKLKEEI